MCNTRMSELRCETMFKDASVRYKMSRTGGLVYFGIGVELVGVSGEVTVIVPIRGRIRTLTG